MNPLVSIIVPNYNHARYLPERLESIYNQTYDNVEVILLDDCSTDDSVSILEKYANHKKTAHFIKNKINSGSPFIQWKRGLALATGDYVWIAESDDTADLLFLESHLNNIKDAAVIVARTQTFTSITLKKEIQHPVFKEREDVFLEEDSLLYCPILNVSACIFKMISKTTLERAQFTNYSIIGDRVFYYEFFQNKRVLLNNNVSSYFRQEGTGVSNLANKGINYLKNYFFEHVRFIHQVANETSVPTQLKKQYVARYFKRVRDRLSRADKLSVAYMKIYLHYLVSK